MPPPLKKDEQTSERYKFGSRKYCNKCRAKTNQQIYSIAAIITTQLGYSGIKQKQQNQSPKWKIQLERKNNKLQTDISNLKNLKGRKWKNNKIKKSLQKRYHLGTQTIKEVSKELEG